jgi:putative nucleotidyltransferase with HDIG domain
MALFQKSKNGPDQKKPQRDTDSLPLLSSRGRRIRPLHPWLRPSPRLLSLCVVVAGIALFFPFTAEVQIYDLPKEGEVAMETVIAPFTFDIMKSPEELQTDRQDAMQSLLLVVDFNTQIKKRIQIRFINLRSAIATLSERSTADSLKESIRAQLGKEFSSSAIQYMMRHPGIIDIAQSQAVLLQAKGILDVLLVPSIKELNNLKIKLNTSFDNYRLYRRDEVVVRKDTVEATVNCVEIPAKEIALERVIDRLRADPDIDAAGLNTVYELLGRFLEPNVTINEEESGKRREQALAEILPFKGKVLKNTEIVRKHQIVTADIRETLRSFRDAQIKLDQYGEKKKARVQNGGKLLLTIVPLILLVFFIKAFRPSLFTNPKHCAALSSIIVLQLAVIRLWLFLIAKIAGVHPDSVLVVPEYGIPMLIVPIFASVLFDMELSFVVSLFIAVYSGVALGFNHSLFMFCFFGGVMSGFAARDIRYRRDFFKVVPPVLAVQALMIILWHIVAYKFSFPSLFQNLGFAGVNCVVSILLVMSLTTVVENIFDITTNMTLIELSDMNHPVLKRLSIEASGTYNHSILVGNLAESAAEKIGANSLLSRVASYYHDIGKIEKADYFVENALGDRNRHSKLAPSMSALIISSHVKDGVELARAHKLPKVIRDAILQHHGTSTVSFFYEKALEKDPHKRVKEEDFCYPGPIPQTRENAVIMLADSVEAASRSLATSSPKLLRELVKKIIRDKFTSSQLDQCDLSLRDLDQIVEGFMPILTGIFHSRIEYPNKP